MIVAVGDNPDSKGEEERPVAVFGPRSVVLTCKSLGGSLLVPVLV